MTFGSATLRRRRLAAALVTTLVVMSPAVHLTARAETAEAGQRFHEIGQINVVVGGSFSHTNSGWLILNSSNRRAYLVSESASETHIPSYDLDSLRPLKRAVVPGIPIPSGFGQETGTATTFSGEIVHAVDPVAKRIYIPINGVPYQATGTPLATDSDAQRMVSHILVLDEAQFDDEPTHAFGAFAFPASQGRLAEYPLMALAVSRHHVGDKDAGKLLGLFASANQFGAVARRPIPGVFDHTLVQWNVSNVDTGQSAPTQALPLAAPPDWEHLLTPCATASMSSPDSEDAPSTVTKNFQWEFLPARDAVFVACQSAPMSGAVVRVPLTATGAVDPSAQQQTASLGKPIGDVMVDPGGGRLYLRSFGKGATWWAFDSAAMRFSGAIAAHQADTMPMAAGIDEGTGRLYTLTPDSCAPRQGGGAVAVRGGIKLADARLDPVPAQENVRPDLAYNSWWKIKVDSVKRRVFIRRGVTLEQLQLVFPECDINKRQPAPVEPFYRVFQDTIPVATQPPPFDDTPFTANVEEAKGMTQASFVGSGSGFGSRVLLTGGLAAASNGASDLGDPSKSPCSRDDRELLIGSVTGVEVSDQSTTANAASLDADSRTQEALGDPVTRCRREAPSPQGDTYNDMCFGDTPGSDEFGFDDRLDDDENEDGCSDRSRENRYAARCIEDATAEPARGPSERAVPRDGFKATAKCERSKEHAQASAEGAVASKELDALSAEESADPPFRVGRSSTTVDVTRTFGKGITVEVTATSRAIEIPGVGSIGAVVATARSSATGRARGAAGTHTRTICDVRIGSAVMSGCSDDKERLASMVKQVNAVLGTRGEMRLRAPDEQLRDGTRHGYLAAVQRDRRQRFADQSLTKDRSLAVPGLELILYQGEGGAWGAGRQVLQLAGVEAATSYGIACVYGQSQSGACLGSDGGLPPDPPRGGDEELGGGGAGQATQSEGADQKQGKGEPTILRILKQIPAAVADAMRLLFNNPVELALLAAVWALLYAPCYLGERREQLRALGHRRATGAAQ